MRLGLLSLREETLVNASLSVLLPVRNAESSLAAMVHEMLDVLPELTPQFELIIVDDASSDSTIEVADELARHFPQLRVVRHGTPAGRATAVRTALAASGGQILFLRDEDCRLPIDEVPRLWRAMAGHETVLGVPPGEPETPGVRGPHSGTCQMFRRRAVRRVERSLSDSTSLVVELARLGYQWHEVPLRNRAEGRHPVALQSGCSRPRRPNYLARIKEFALGE